MTVDEDKITKAPLIKAEANLFEQGDKSTGTNTDRTRKAKVETGCAKGNDRTDDHGTSLLGQAYRGAAADFACFHAVCSQWQVRAMIFGGPHGDEDNIGLFEHLLHFRACHLGERCGALLNIKDLIVSHDCFSPD